jgi:uncharacterized protein DUF4214
MRTGIILLIIVLTGVTALAQNPSGAPTLRIVTETPGLPSELYYGDIKVKPLRLRPGTNKVITIDDIDFFVHQQYIDFLGRMPDTTGFKNWNDTISGCPNGGYGLANSACDRVHAAKSFYQSYEFQTRGYFVYKFYEVAFDRRALYGEFIPDMVKVGGPKSPQEEADAKIQYMNDFVLRPEFQNRYTGSNAAYVNALETNAEVTVSNKQALIDALNGGTKTRAQVLREIVESQAVEDKFYVRGFVTMMYFGFVRRNPDQIGFDNYVVKLNQTGDPRAMVFDFIYSDEYRNRF